MRPVVLPPPRPVLHPMRDVAGATTSVRELPGHRRRVTIDHQPLRGITPKMLLWWFENIGGTMPYGGGRLASYLAWHPLDHIRWELARPAPGGGAAEGARFRIVEAFGRRPEYAVDTVERVERLDHTGIRLVRRVAGVPVFELSHTWSACDHGAHYVSVMEVGARSRLFAPVNRHLTRRVLPRDMVEAWVRHNVEEVGLLEHLLPVAYAERSPSSSASRLARA
jgi:hypothetical protein